MNEIIIYIEQKGDGVFLTTKDENISDNFKYLKTNEGTSLSNEITNVLIEDNQTTSVTLIGKYICVTSIVLDTKSYNMIFCEVKGNIEKAKIIVDNFNNQMVKDLFWKRYSELDKLDINSLHQVVFRIRL